MRRHMRRLFRILLNAATAVSLVLLCGSVGLMMALSGDRREIDRRIGREHWVIINPTGAALYRYRIIPGVRFRAAEMNRPVVSVDFGALFLLSLLLPTGRAVWWSVERARRDAAAGRNGVCPACGYDLRATPDRCPECGSLTRPLRKSRALSLAWAFIGGEKLELRPIGALPRTPLVCSTNGRNRYSLPVPPAPASVASRGRPDGRREIVPRSAFPSRGVA